MGNVFIVMKDVSGYGSYIIAVYSNYYLADEARNAANRTDRAYWKGIQIEEDKHWVYVAEVKETL